MEAPLWQAVLTACVLLGVLVALAKEIVQPALGLLLGLAVLLVAGIVSPEEAFSGFSNSAVLTVAALFVVAAAVQRTDALSFLDTIVFREGGGIRGALLRLTTSTSLMSAFLNNTPIVAMLTPRVQAWTDSSRLAASKLLMPMSFAAILGGMCTLIGTSTNIVVSGLLDQSGYEPLGMFDLTWIGLPAAVAALIYMVAVGHKLLPDQRRKDGTLDEGLRECLFEVRVSQDSVLVGSTLEEAGLRALGNAYLVHIRRKGAIMAANPQVSLQPRDVLTFVGSLNVIEDLLRRPGLERVMSAVGSERYETLPLYEAVVAPNSQLVDKTLKECNFRERYNGVVLAVQRKDERISGPLGRTPLRPGDLLLIEAIDGFDRRWNARRDEFYLVAPRRGTQRLSNKRKRPLALMIVAVMVAIFSFGLLPIVTAAFVAALLVVVTGCLTISEASRAVDVRVLVVIAAAFGIGLAVENSGLAGYIASALIGGTGMIGPAATVLALYVVTNVLTEVITNNAAAVLMLPVAIAAAVSLNVDPAAFAIVVAIAASASFLTPLGYQTNLIVMAPGSYRFKDYFRAGLPVSLIVASVTVAMVGFLWL